MRVARRYVELSDGSVRLRLWRAYRDQRCGSSRRSSASTPFDKLRAIDCTLAEFELLLDAAEIIEEVDLDPDGTKELLLVIDWTRPLHIVVVVDSSRREERLVTVYEPDAERWTDGYRRRR